MKIYIGRAVLRHGAQKSLLRRHVDNDVGISEQFIGCTWCAVRLSRGKGCFAGRAGKMDNSDDVCTVLFRRERSSCSTVLVFEIVVRYCFRNCSTVLF